jgi:molybdopterin-biosynthesis enzyme MoeA-like protein
VDRFESDIADDLNALLNEYPDLMLGSYPRIGEVGYHVMLTLESRNAVYLDRAVQTLRGKLAADAIYKIE